MYAYPEVKQSLARLIAKAMYMEVNEIDDNQLFSSFGLESATLVKIIARFNDEHGSDIDVHDVLPHQTLRDASVFMFEELTARPPQEKRA